MKLFSAFGMIVAIIGLQYLMPEVVSGLEATLIKFFEFAQVVLDFGQAHFERGGGL